MIELKSPVDVQIELTEVCNQRCGHCYNFWRHLDNPHKHSSFFSVEQLRLLINELSANEVLSITITGGEPFLRKRELFALLDMAKEKNIHVSINTNLSCASHDDIKLLSKKYPHVSLLVSLLSCNPDEHEQLSGSAKGTHKHVVELIRHATGYGIKVSINMVVMRSNLASLRKTAELAKHLGVSVFCATKALPNSISSDTSFVLSISEVLAYLNELVEIEKELRIPVEILGCYPKCIIVDTPIATRFSHRICVAGRTTVTISPDGSIRACSHTEKIGGNIYTDGLLQAWQSFHEWRANAFVPLECRKCHLVDTCAGGCRMNTRSGKLTDMDMHATPKKIKFTTTRAKKSKEYIDLQIFRGHVKIPLEVGIRKESFGAIIFRKDKWSVIMVNKTCAEFLQKMLETQELFNIDDFIKHSGATSVHEIHITTKLFHKLYTKKLVISQQ